MCCSFFPKAINLCKADNMFHKRSPAAPCTMPACGSNPAGGLSEFCDFNTADSVGLMKENQATGTAVFLFSPSCKYGEILKGFICAR